jgi:hypothetical protein
MDYIIYKKIRYIFVIQILVIIINFFCSKKIFLKKISNHKLLNRNLKKNISISGNCYIITKCVKENQFCLTFDDGPNDMTISHLDYFK